MDLVDRSDRSQVHEFIGCALREDVHYAGPCVRSYHTNPIRSMLNIRLVHDSQFLHGDMSGQLDLEASRKALCHLLAEGAEDAGSAPGSYDLLFDVRDADIDMELKEVWELLQDLDACDPGFDGQLALLDDWDDTFDRMQFFEDSARQISIQAKAFIDFESAVRWLWESRDFGETENIEVTGGS